MSQLSNCFFSYDISCMTCVTFSIASLKKTFVFWNQFSLSFVSVWASTTPKEALAQVMVWHRTGDKPLPEPMVTKLTASPGSTKSIHDKAIQVMNAKVTLIWDRKADHWMQSHILIFIRQWQSAFATDPGMLCNTGYPSKTHLKLKSRKISFVHKICFNCPIVSKFYIEHGSITAVLCAKFQND